METPRPPSQNSGGRDIPTSSIDAYGAHDGGIGGGGIGAALVLPLKGLLGCC